MIFNALSDFMADKQRRPYAATLQEVFTFSLQADQAMQVRIAALKALGGRTNVAFQRRSYGA